MPKLTSLFILLFLAACTKVDLQKVDNLNGGNISIIGHGGSGYPYDGFNIPANTFESVVKAVEGFNVDGVELDIQISRDSVLFLFHDEELSPLTDCGGCLINKDSAALAGCRYRQNISSHVFKNHLLTTLEQLIQRFSKRSSPPTLLLDIKLFKDCTGSPDDTELLQRMAGELNWLIKRYNAADWVFIETASAELLELLHEMNENIQLIWLMGPGRPNAEFFEQAKKYNIYGFSLINDDLSADIVKLFQGKGFRVILYDIRTREAAVEAVSKSPDFIETDDILLLQQILSK